VVMSMKQRRKLINMLLLVHTTLSNEWLSYFTSEGYRVHIFAQRLAFVIEVLRGLFFFSPSIRRGRILSN
jgi:hypothetical protein